MNDQLNQNPLENEETIKDENSVSEDTHAIETETIAEISGNVEMNATEPNHEEENIHAFEDNTVVEPTDTLETVSTEEIVATEDTPITKVEDVVEGTGIIETKLAEANAVVEEIPAIEAETGIETLDVAEANVVTETVSDITEAIEAVVEEVTTVVEEIPAVETAVAAEVSDIVEDVVEETTAVVEEIHEVVAEAIVEVPEMVEAASEEVAEEVETVVAEIAADVASEIKEEAEPIKAVTKELIEHVDEESHELLSAHDFIAEEEEHELEIEHIIDFTVLSKEELILKLEELVRNDSIAKIKAMVSGIKVSYLNKIKEEKQAHLEKYLEDGGTKEEYVPIVDSMEERFKAAFDVYKEKKTKDDHEQDKQKTHNLQLKKQILEEIKVLVNSEESLKKTYDDFKLLQDTWKQIGMVPRNEIEGLWNNYHFLVEEFFKKVKINKELKDLDLKKNLELKVLLCEKTEELLMEKSIAKSFKLLQKYHEDWKEIGPVMLDKKDEIWERFKNVSDKINSQRKEYYDKMTGEQDTNLLAKTALCEKIEEINGVEITTAEDWTKKTDEVLELQKLWDSIGRAPVKFHDLIWERFRGAVNIFFETKKEHFGGLKDEQTNNYNLKLDICVQVEGMANSTTWKQTTADILKLQQDWKTIGPVPKRYADKIWRRFRAACDVYFKSKSAYFSNINGIEKENLKKKEELLERIGTYVVSDDKSENLNSLKSIQREWMEIGHVPIEHKDRLQGLYRTAINSLMDRLKLSSSEVSTMNYKTRIETIQNSPDAGKFISKERVQMEGRITMLANDIKLWENNIGFLASSKKASILKDEFEKKIQESKQELALLEAKLKLLAKQ